MNASKKFPSKSSIKDLCNPHPGQSIPNSFLFKQGIK